MELYLGIDASTQGMKTVLIDAENGTFAGSSAVNFAADLPQYGEPCGFLPCSDPLVCCADPRMWLDALELALKRLQESGADMAAIRAVSGSAQQHGTVYLNRDFPALLAEQGSAPLSETLKHAFSRELSPIWMDRSTSRECAELMRKFKNRLRNDTGSPAVERFGASQIRKFAKQNPGGWENTAFVHLISSFMASVMTGKSAPLDYGDGSGMNLLNLRNFLWDRKIAEFTASGLLDKLPCIRPSLTIAGKLSGHFAAFGMRPGIPVVIWTGDNPSSLIGVGGGEPGTAVISLGTSDTFFASMREFTTDPAGCGNVFGNPQGGFMSLTCFTNGSPAREKVRDLCGADWEFFGKTACAMTPAGNNGKLMLPYFMAESTPHVLTPGAVYNFDFESAAPAEKIRCILESQALSMRLHSMWQNETFKAIRLTGGASACEGLRQILADVFQVPVQIMEVANSAGTGAAIRAAVSGGGHSFREMYDAFCAPVETVQPNPENAGIYAEMLKAYAALEKSVTEPDKQPGGSVPR